MKLKLSSAAALLAAAMLFSLPAQARNGEFPVPDTVSPQLQKMIAKPVPKQDRPPSVEEIKADVARIAQKNSQYVAKLKEKLSVETYPGKLGNVPVYTVLPKNHAKDDSRILLHFHGGGYIYNPGEAGLVEAINMAGLTGMKVISVDYRMAPDHPYPAALDDALAVYRELLKTHAPEEIGVFGTSTGGGLTLALALRARDEGLPLPGALAPGTPWTDLTKTGDTYFTNDGLDNILGSYDGWVGESARLYAGGHDLKDPYLSPVYGNVHGLPPTLLTAGTRDLFLSNTVRMHKKLLEAEIPALLIVFEGMSHAAYMISPDVPESQFHFRQLKKFFDQYLKGKSHSQEKMVPDGNKTKNLVEDAA